MSRSTRSRNFKIGLLGLIVSLLAILFIVNTIDMELFVSAWRTARYGYVLPVLVLLFLGLVTRAIRWQVLLNGDLPLLRAFSIMNVAYLVNGLLPLRIGELARIFLAGQSSPPVPALRCTSTIIVERLLDLLAVVVLLALALAAGPVPAQLRWAASASAVLALVGFVILVWLAVKRSLAHRILSGVKGIFTFLQRFAIDEWLDHFLDGLQPLTRPSSFLSAVGWTVVSWCLSVLAGYVLMFAFFEQGSWAATAMYIAAAAFAIALPAVPGNVGTYEASILLALSAAGYDPSGTALAFAVMVHAVNVFVHASTGVVGFIQEGISLGQLTQGVQRMKRAAE